MKFPSFYTRFGGFVTDRPGVQQWEVMVFTGPDTATDPYTKTEELVRDVWAAFYKGVGMLPTSVLAFHKPRYRAQR